MSYPKAGKRKYCEDFIRDIRDKRFELGLSIKDFAKYLGLNTTTVYRYENQLVFPRRHIFILICKKLELNPDDYKIDSI